MLRFRIGLCSRRCGAMFRLLVSISNAPKNHTDHRRLVDVFSDASACEIAHARCSPARFCDKCVGVLERSPSAGLRERGDDFARLQLIEFGAQTFVAVAGDDRTNAVRRQRDITHDTRREHCVAYAIGALFDIRTWMCGFRAGSTPKHQGVQC